MSSTYPPGQPVTRARPLRRSLSASRMQRPLSHVVPHFAIKPRTDDGSAKPLACEGTTMRLGIAVGLLTLVGGPLVAADYPTPVDGDVTLHDFQFASGEKLPEVRIHYRTLGTAKTDERGV